jgi:hypothetical protein
MAGLPGFLATPYLPKCPLVAILKRMRGKGMFMGATQYAAKTTIGTGFFLLFALPFAGAGVWIGVWLAGDLLAHSRMQSWEGTPAVIVRAKLDSQSDAEGGTSNRATAEYTYQYRGQQYTGRRVAVHGGGDNIGSFQQNAYRQLEEHRKSGRPFRCYVNPAKPSEAILFRDLRWEIVLFKMVAALVFGFIGFGLSAAAVFGSRKLRADKALAALHPDEPWLCKKDWADGKIKASGKAATFILVAFTAIWSLAAAPAWLMFRENRIVGEWSNLVGMLFPVFGLMLIWCSIGAVLRRRKFGRAVFEMASTPGVIGGQLAGVIRIPAKIEPEDGFCITLNCVQKKVCGDSAREDVLWQDEQRIARGLSDSDPDESAIPVLFQIPYDCRPTDETTSQNETIWRLAVSAKGLGANVAIDFNVPVFQTPESDPSFVVDRNLIAEYVEPDDPDRDLDETGVIKTRSFTGKGFRLVFPMARMPGTAFLFLLGACIFGGIPIGLSFTDTPWFVRLLFGVLFAFFGLFLLLASFDLWFFRSVVDVSASGLTVVGGWLGVNRRREIDVADIEKIVPYSRMSTSNGPTKKVYYDIDVIRKTGKKVTIGKRIFGKRLVESVIRQIEEGLGKR